MSQRPHIQLLWLRAEPLDRRLAVASEGKPAGVDVRVVGHGSGRDRLRVGAEQVFVGCVLAVGERPGGQRNLAIAILKPAGHASIPAACRHHARDATRTLTTLGLSLP